MSTSEPVAAEGVAALACIKSNILRIEQESDRRDGKGRRCWLGDVLECHTSHLAARMILRKVFGRTSILGGWWFGMWCELDDYPFFQSIHSAKDPRPIFILVLPIILKLNG